MEETCTCGHTVESHEFGAFRAPCGEQGCDCENVMIPVEDPIETLNR